MSDTDRDLVYSESVKAGKRIYYFDVKQSRNGERYLSITESKKTNEGTTDNPRFVYEKHKLFLYKEDYEKFVNALVHTLEIAKGNEPAEKSEEAPSDNTAEAAPAESAESDADDKSEKKSFLDKVKGIF